MIDDMVIIKTFGNETEAEIAKAHLESEGIKAMITIKDVGGMLPSLQQSEGVHLLVDEKDAKRALEIIEEK